MMRLIDKPQFWYCMMILSVGAILALLLHVNYAHGFVAKDFNTIIAGIATAMGVMWLKDWFGQ